MAIKFQYNKTSLTNLGKQLKVRQNALPTLKNKESALRSSVQTAKAESERLSKKLKEAAEKGGAENEGEAGKKDSTIEAFGEQNRRARIPRRRPCHAARYCRDGG